MHYSIGLRPQLKTHGDQISSLIIAGLAAIVIGAGSHVMLQRVTTDFAAVTQETSETASREIKALPTDALNELKQLAVTAANLAPAPEPITRQIEIRRGQSLQQALIAADVDPDDAQQTANAVAAVYKLKSLQAGTDLTLNFTQMGDDETFDGMVFQPEITVEIRVTRAAEATAANPFKAEKIVTPLERKRIAVRGTLNGSLYTAGARYGVPRSIMSAMIRVYSHDIDFQRDLKTGDKFEVYYDQPMTADGKTVGEGTIIYAAIEVRGTKKAVYRVIFPGGSVDYFNDRGQSVRKAIMRTPVDGARMTSSFGMRRHPILGYSKMHEGVDFGAPYGTPIYAAGDGVIEKIGFEGGYGRYIRLRHNSSLSTAYAHMSRFARGLRPGSRVDQGDVIGYVGSSGRSTGPHLHFETIVGGRKINPMTVQASAGRSLDGRSLTQFKEGITRIKAEFATTLAGIQPAQTQLASNTPTKTTAK